MSQSTNSNVNFCDVCDFSFETKKDFYRHQSYDSKHKELLETVFGSDGDAQIPENMERVYDSEEEYYYLRPKLKTESKPKGASPLMGHRPAAPRVPQTESKSKTESIPKENTKDIFRTKPITRPKTKTEDSIYSRIRYDCKEC